jgi:hypothetical protein
LRLNEDLFENLTFAVRTPPARQTIIASTVR